MNDENTSTVNVENESSPGNRRANAALIRCIAALLLAVILLWATGFSIVTMLRGPVESADIQAEEQGAFVYRDINFILGFYADDYSKGENPPENYAMVPMGGKFVSVLFTDRYMESAQALCENTYGYINGSTEPNKYVTVQGTVDMLTEAESKNMYDWFDLNKDQMVEIGLIRDTDDASEYLSDYVLLVDTVNGRGQNQVIALSVIAALLLVYMLVEMVLMARGVYLPKEARAGSSEEAETESVEAEKPEESPAEEQEKQEDSGEPEEPAEESEKPEAAEEEEPENAESEEEPDEKDGESEACGSEEEVKPEDKEQGGDEA